MSDHLDNDFELDPVDFSGSDESDEAVSNSNEEFVNNDDNADVVREESLNSSNSSDFDSDNESLFYSQPTYNFNQPQQQNSGYQSGGYYGGSTERQQGYNPQQPPQYNFNNLSPSAQPPQRKKSSGGKVIAVAVIVIAVIVAFVAIISSFGSGNNVQNTTGSGNAETTLSEALPGDKVAFATTDPSNTSLMTGVQVAEKARPSVVGVMTYVDGQLSGEGSGVVMSVDSSGKYTYIITCAHVISERGVTYGVRTLEGKNYTAELVAYDTRTDIGVLKVEATDLPVAEFGDSSSLKVGEPVYAIGNPGGSEYFGSMTNGIISAIDRSITSTYTMTCIQHNAAINPGNSGGALVNSAGQVIGINSSKIAATDYEGMGFAVPMAIVKPVVDSLIQYKYVPNRPKLGIEYASVSSYQLYSMVVAIKGLPAGSLVIAGISSDSSLANTDAQVGDLIIAVNGKDMNTSDVLLDLINTGAVGDTLTLTLCRVENRTYKTTTFDVTITLVEDKGVVEEETTTQNYNDGYYHGGASSFEDFFEGYFGF